MDLHTKLHLLLALMHAYDFKKYRYNNYFDNQDSGFVKNGHENWPSVLISVEFLPLDLKPATN